MAKRSRGVPTVAGSAEAATYSETRELRLEIAAHLYGKSPGESRPSDKPLPESNGGLHAKAS
jgi:hypothetical protein